MFVGHFGVALGAKKLAPEVSLGTMFLAAQFADLLWPNLVLLGVEKLAIEPGATEVTPLNFISYPYSHSLFSLVVWGVLFAVIHRLVRGPRKNAAIVLAALVVSHWVLDFVAHRPDLPLLPTDGPRYGLGLWNNREATMLVELTIFAVGVVLYLRSTTARDRIGRFGFFALIGFLLAIYLANMYSPPPPTVSAVAWTAQAMWLLVAWGYWVDRHRTPRLLTRA